MVDQGRDSFGGGRMDDEELRRRVEARAKELWQAAGAPKGNDLEFWLQAERECADLSAAGEEDPLAALDDLGPGALDSSGPR